LTNATLTPTQLNVAGKGLLKFSSVGLVWLRGNNAGNTIDASAATTPVYLEGRGGSDLLIGGSGDDVLDGGSGDDQLRGGGGSDVYWFGPQTSGAVTVDESAGSGEDTLDFTSYIAAVSVDLASLSVQSVATTLTLSLMGAIENAFGSEFNDTLLGNALDNKLYGGAGEDYLSGGAGRDTLAAGRPRFVFLDFDSASEAGEHVYSPTERAAIIARMRADYAPFDISFSEQRPTSGPYATILFNASVYIPGNTLTLGGISDRIGFRELASSGLVQVDVNGFLGTATNKLPGTSENFVALSSTIAEHELGHFYGLRHSDAFGPPGSGVFSAKNIRNRFRPTYSGPIAATETRLHLIASPAAVGTSLIDALGNPFFGERETVKLAFGESGHVVPELADSAKTPSGQFGRVQSLGELTALSVPNQVVTGINAGQTLNVGAVAVTGNIGLTNAGISENDFYSFSGHAGDVVTIEIMSQALRHRFPNIIDSLIRVYDSSGQKVAYYGNTLSAFNDDLFEPTDSLLIDLVLPSSGTFTIEVDTFSFAAPEFSAYQPGFNIATFSAANPNNIYVTDTDTGQYELFIYRVGNTVPVFNGGDTLAGGAGPDLLLGNSGRETVYGYNPAEDNLIDPFGNPFFSGSAPTLDLIGPQTAVEGDTVTFTAGGHDLDGETLTYRLETVAGQTFAVGATINSLTGLFNFATTDNGSFVVRVVVEDSSGAIAFEEVIINISNANPIANAGDDVSGTEGSPVILAGAFTDPGTADTQTFAWSIKNAANVVVATGANQAITFTPTDNGVYTAMLTVTDDDGGFTSDIALVTVANANPIANAGVDKSVVEGTAVTLTGSFSDPGTADTQTFAWSIKNAANVVVATGTNPAITFIPTDNGVYTATFTVTDDDGGSTTDVALINVANSNPAITSLNVIPGAGGVINLSAAFTDASMADTHTASVNWGNGIIQSIPVSQLAGGGTTAGSYTYQTSGTYTVVLTITDDDGGLVSQSASVTVTVGPTAGVSVVNGELRIIMTTFRFTSCWASTRYMPASCRAWESNCSLHRKSIACTSKAATGTTRSTFRCL